MQTTRRAISSSARGSRCCYRGCRSSLMRFWSSTASVDPRPIGSHSSPGGSVSIFPDCKNVVFSTEKELIETGLIDSCIRVVELGREKYSWLDFSTTIAISSANRSPQIALRSFSADRRDGAFGIFPIGAYLDTIYHAQVHPLKLAVAAVYCAHFTLQKAPVWDNVLE